MFIYNIKLNLKNIVKITFFLMVIIVTVMFLISVYRIIKTSFKVRDELNAPEKLNIEAENYTNVLKTVYEDIDDYVGQKISFIGYVYKSIDFNEDQFVLARDMLVDEKHQTLIVGFLCEYSKAKDFEEGTWVKVIGKIVKGYYHGELPIIKVLKIQKVDKPENELVYPPESTYIQTSFMLNN